MSGISLQLIIIYLNEIIVSEVQDIFFKYFIEFKKKSLKRDSGTGAFLWILRNF